MMKKEKGAALIIVLVTSVIILFAASYILKLSRDLVVQYRSILEKLETKIESKSYLEVVKYTFTVSEFRYNYLQNLSQTKLLPQKISLIGKPIEIGNTKIIIYDTASKINTLYLTKKYINGLLPDNEKNLVNIAYDSYEDWKDKDKFKRLNGAEDYYYKYENNYRYGPRNNGALQDKEELKNIRGFSKIYEKIQDKLTFVYKGGLVNVNTASEEILSASLGIPLDTAKQLILLRNKNGKIDVTDIQRIISKKISAVEYEMISFFPSKNIILIIETEKGKAKEKLKAVIDFHETDKTPFTVIKYIE